MSAKKAAKSKLSVEFSLSESDGKKWNKPQAAAKEMQVAIGKLAKLIADDGRKLGKISVEMQMNLGVPACEVEGRVTEV